MRSRSVSHRARDRATRAIVPGATAAVNGHGASRSRDYPLTHVSDGGRTGVLCESLLAGVERHWRAHQASLSAPPSRLPQWRIAPQIADPQVWFRVRSAETARGIPSGLRANPWNLIRLKPAKGVRCPAPSPRSARSSGDVTQNRQAEAAGAYHVQLRHRLSELAQGVRRGRPERARADARDRAGRRRITDSGLRHQRTAGRRRPRGAAEAAEPWVATRRAPVPCRSPSCNTRGPAEITPEMEYIAIREGLPVGVRSRRSRARPRDHSRQRQSPRARADDHRPELPREDQRQHRQLRGLLVDRGGSREAAVGDAVGRRHRDGSVHRQEHPRDPRVDHPQLAGADRHGADLSGAREGRAAVPRT